MDNNKRPYTIAGLAYFLGVCRATVYNYESREKYSDIISRARERCIMYLEEQLITQGKGGQIFLAKNYGYTDRQEIINTEVKTTDEELWEFENALYED
jgi:predicted transcriptional regulator